MKTRLLRRKNGRLVFVSSIGNVTAFANERQAAMRAICAAHQWRVFVRAAA